MHDFRGTCTRSADQCRSEFFLPLLLHGRFVVERDTDDVLVRFQENQPLKMSALQGLPPCFSILAYRRLINNPIANILRDFSDYCGRPVPWTDNAPTKTGISADEMQRIGGILTILRPQSTEHWLCVALLVYIFNLHNQHHNDDEALSILDSVALEMVTTHTKGSVTERQYTIWTIVTIGATATLSPWRLDLPFMGHVIAWMEHDSDLDNLTNMLRGYYLYGASKEVLRSGLDNWYKD